jgi:hypothetical protein
MALTRLGTFWRSYVVFSFNDLGQETETESRVCKWRNVFFNYDRLASISALRNLFEDSKLCPQVRHRVDMPHLFLTNTKCQNVP